MSRVPTLEETLARQAHVMSRLALIERMQCLARNLAIAAALNESFDAGYVDGYHTANRERGIGTDPRYPDLRDWRPNALGQAMPGRESCPVCKATGNEPCDAGLHS